MRYLLSTLFIFVSIALLPGCTMKVEHLHIRDARLPVEARRWLADAEDEVAIARAHVDDANSKLNRVETYRENTVSRIKGGWSKGGPDGQKAWQAFSAYVEARVLLAEMSLAAAETAHLLAIRRLHQARTETAMRHDLAVYDMAPIIASVEEQKNAVAIAIKKVENQRVVVERKADEAWKAYYTFVQKGGVSNALWYTD